MNLSIVIPTCRRRALLQRCLAAVLTQTMPPASYQIVVSDDGGEPDLAHLVRTMGERFGRFDIKYVSRRGDRPQGPAAARNLGWRASQGQVLAFTDDDCVPSSDWLEEGWQAMAGADAAQGRILVPLPDAPTDQELNVSRLEAAPCATANFFCRRAALEKVGGFDERFKRAWREDSDLHFSLLERGLRVKHAARAVVVHPPRKGRWAGGLSLERNNFYEALLYKKHPRLYRQIIGGAPWRYYFVAACLAAGAAGLVFHQPALKWAGALWAAWTARFWLRRLGPTSKHPLHVAEMLVTSALIPLMSVFWRVRGALAFGVVFF